MIENFILVVVILSVINLLLLFYIVKRITSSKGGAEADLVRGEFRISRQENADDAKRLREEIGASQKTASETLVTSIRELGKLQKENLDDIEKRIKSIETSNETRLQKLTETIEQQIKSLQESNEKKLDQMRVTVDEKLHNTLEKRLGESFKLVSERLEAVQRGLGEMQTLTTGVGDLKRMLTNVKARGTWGEFQLGDILDQILTPEQFEKNVKPRVDSNEIVEFAIRLPGQGNDTDTIWLPIDSKFPQEDYQRLIDAAEVADTGAVERSTMALLRAIEQSAKDISAKYIEPPYTTDFAIMFLPTEGLYSEVLRQPGIVEKLQHDHRVVVAGPTTLAAILNSLRMGFRTLAIEKRSSEVWTILSAVKTEFGKFGEVLARVKKQLDTASNTIDKTGVRTRAMEKKLRNVEALPSREALELLDIDDDTDEEL
jgi:DNA recombination protein RmuC